MQQPYYKLYVPRMTVGELWRGTPNIVVFVILCFMKLFRLNLMPHFAVEVPGPHNVADFTELPERGRVAMVPLQVECEAIGFTPRFATVAQPLGNHESCSIIMSGDDRRTYVTLSHGYDWNNNASTEILEAVFTSQASDGTVLLTTNNHQLPRMQHPLDVEVVREKKLADVYRQHCRRLDAQRGMVRTLATRDELFDLAMSSTQIIFDQLIERRLLIEITDEERQYLKKLNPLNDQNESGEADPGILAHSQPAHSALQRPGPTAASSLEAEFLPSPPGGESRRAGSKPDEAGSPADAIEPPTEPTLHPEDQQVLIQIHGKQTQTISWVAKLMLLLVSLAAFVGLGALAWNWELIVLLIPILLFHELGHYMAMRMLKYRNIKMFFLPLIGAGVHGRHYNAPGWQRAVVALAGPIPGILLGAGIALAGVQLGLPMLVPVAVLTILLNALNLLPFLPFDGGWVMQAVVFSRNLYLEFFFKVAATVVLGLLGLGTRSRLLMFLAVFMAMGLPLAWRLCKLATGMKRDGILPHPQRGHDLCEPTIREVVKRVRLQTQTPLAQRANVSLNIYELLSARPPGFFTSLVLLGVQFGALVGSVVFVWWLIAGQIPNAAMFGGLPQPPPEPVIEIRGDQVRVGQLPPPLSDEQLATVVVTCEDEQQRAVALQTLGNLPNVAVSQLGQSLVVDVAASDRDRNEQVLEICRDFDETAILDVTGNRTAVEMQVTFRDSAATRKVYDAMDAYLSCNHLNVVPPWSSTHDVTEQQQRARKTWNQLAALDSGELTGEMGRLADQLDKAFRSNDIEEQTRLIKLQQRIGIQQTIRAVRELQESEGVDRAVCDLYLTSPDLDADLMSSMSGFGDADDEAAAAARQEEYARRLAEFDRVLTPLLGQLPGDAEASPRLLDESMPMGYVIQEGETLYIESSSFHRTGTGLAALVKWLEQQGASDIRYAIYDRFRGMNIPDRFTE